MEAVIDDEPLLSEHLLKLAEWIAAYYLAPLGEVLRGMLPLMAEVRRVVYYRITDLGATCWRRVLMAMETALRSRARDRARGASGAVEAGKSERRVLERLAAGEPVKVSTLRTATAAILPVLVGMLRKKWIARETAAVERDARRTERFAVLIPDTRLPALTETAAGDSRRAGRKRRGASAWPNCAAANCHLPRCRRWFGGNWCASKSGAAAFRLGGIEAPAQPLTAERVAAGCACVDRVAAWGISRFLASWRNGLREDGRLPESDATRAGSRAIGHSAGAGDRADAANGWACWMQPLASAWRCCTRR